MLRHVSAKAHSYDPAYKHNFHTIMCLFHESMKQIKKQRHTTLLAQRIKRDSNQQDLPLYIFPSFKIRDVLPMTFLFFWELENKRTRSDFLKTVFSNFLSGNENKNEKTLIDLQTQLQALHGYHHLLEADYKNWITALILSELRMLYSGTQFNSTT